MGDTLGLRYSSALHQKKLLHTVIKVDVSSVLAMAKMVCYSIEIPGTIQEFLFRVTSVVLLILPSVQCLSQAKNAVLVISVSRLNHSAIRYDWSVRV
jgi:hypothetical protein